jgi:FkbM family methyltransferase
MCEHKVALLFFANKWNGLKSYLRKREISRHLSAGDIAIDCGANTGTVTKFMARPGVKVFAFEPNLFAFKVLQKKFEHQPNVVCLNQAVAHKAGKMKLFLHKQAGENQVHWSTGSSLLSSKENIDPNDYLEVDTVDLCEFVEKNAPIKVLKIDIEGAEVELLNRFIDLGLHQKVGMVLVETHERIATLAEPTQRLRDRIKTEKIKNIDLTWE